MKGVCLISGGLDSAVAADVMLKKGVEISAVHFSIEPFTDNSPELKTIEACKKLGIKKLTVVKAGALFADFTKNCDHKLYFILSKRLMYRIASEFAKQDNADFLITGESLGQVSSQTLKNLSMLSLATDMKVIRPLLAWDKNMIIDHSRKEELFEICSGPEVCDQLGPKHPATSTTEKVVEIAESKVDIVKMVMEGMNNAESYSLS